MTLLEGFKAVALALQEEATDLSHNDIRSRLSDALQSHSDDSGQSCSLCDVFGDDDSGDVVYSQGPSWQASNLKKAPYSFGKVNGKSMATIDHDQAVDVMPQTTYEEKPDDDDVYASMEAAFKKAKLYTELPLYERFISKDERDAADTSDFAGKGKSFPILKPGDVMAAVKSMGRAGDANSSTGTLKKNIIAIAKRKGWTKYLPQSWQAGGDTTEARRNVGHGALSLVESAATFDQIILTEAAAVKATPIKVIAPGAGSSAFYPKEVLQRDGPKVFKAGTHVYVNHPTQAEESARPEGDVKNLAGVLTKDAEWRDSFVHKGVDQGAGLYSEVKPFSDHANLFSEKGQFLGMSIRASGKAESKQSKGGLPVLTELTSAESVDVVTRAGAGGMILQEGARTAAIEEDEEMKDTRQLIEAALQPVLSRQRKADAFEQATELLEGVSLPDAAKKRIVERVVESLDLTVDVDPKKLREAVVAESKSEGEYLAELTGSGRVTGMGSASVAESGLSKKERKALKEARKEQAKGTVSIFERLGMPKNAAEIAAKGRVA
jgi:hypothetical protein